MRITLSNFPMQNIIHVMDGEGLFYQHVVGLDTDSGEIHFVRCDANGDFIEMPNPPKGVPGRVASTDSVIAKTPLTITLAGTMEQNEMQATGGRLDTETPLISLFKKARAYDNLSNTFGEEGEPEYPLSYIGSGFIQQGDQWAQAIEREDEQFDEEFDGEEENWDKDSSIRFPCPCCSAPMRETYSSQLNWYLKCTECEAMTIRQ